MPVENTASPSVCPMAPNGVPVKIRPSSSTSTALLDVTPRPPAIARTRGDRVVGYPDRACTGALQHDSFGIAGQHGLSAVAQVTYRDAVEPAGRQRAADVEALGAGNQRRADGIR